MIINNIKISKILNSLGNWTIEVTILTDKCSQSASVPQGESTGKYEAKYVTVEKAIQNLAKITPHLIGTNFESIEDFDSKLLNLDGTSNKQKLGANLILALSIATTKSFAHYNNKEAFEFISEHFGFTKKIPEFSLLIFEGGKHGSNYLTIQEFMLITSGIEDSLKILDTYKKYLTDNHMFVGYGLEGAFTSSQLHDIQVLDLFKSLTPENKIALDIAESSREGEMLDFSAIMDKYNIFSIEDPKQEEDYPGWKNFYDTYGEKVLVVADDLTTTNATLIQNSQKEQLANAVIIKPNQVGSITETIKAVKVAREKNWKIVVSHRSGDTNDDFISDLSVGIGAEYVKFGSIQRGERVAKFNRILQIEKLLNS
ncbi:hypothetical protein COV24_01730 [candidate division WWE3 bacterium CG10_big_fil_rev_8_21_14_0_10_32_10]|uniref:Enolase n=1 Tax=candidate division WWE3 bacterium CG10_big_fil_rev_8_21_14_0_10_32_10 TaxID=1975090 RepID=A0A2H0RAZ4_UNCKA|nr:MAG: hypothetical protein COV24_01730 [candidate division WWE3 bacterium CG10_big_fil_rev_8_21_14_0_10_32_10]